MNNSSNNAYRNVSACYFIDAIHYFFKRRPVPTISFADSQHKAVGVYHFMQERLDQILPWPQLEQRLAQSYNAAFPQSI